MSASARLPLPSGIPATDTETEQEILRAIEAASGRQEQWESLWRLVLFYQKEVKRSDLAVALLELMIQESSTDPESTALIYFVLGQIAQADEKWALASEHYENGLSLLPKERDTAYFLRNNLGYCLNAQGLYSAGERYCRQAIEIDCERQNAFKNLGVSLYGQGDLKGAAWCWIEGIKVDPSNGEARNLLDQLLTKHPALKTECAWIQQELEYFRKILQS
jgi:tetratricopeptide (TPR) repeat protein